LFSNPELKHGYMRPNLPHEPQPLYDSVVKINQFFFT